MDNAVKLWEIPTAKEIYMIAGWNQWADAGSISSGLPLYLIDTLDARQIGEIQHGDFYLFQVPGTHHLLRPEVELEEGYRVKLRQPSNEIYYTGDEEKGLVIFTGEEPHLNMDRYAEAFLDIAGELNIKRVVTLGGVYGMMPYNRDREVSCVYSLPRLKPELEKYAVKFSNYEGGATIGVCIADRAEKRDVELADFYVFVPAYDFTQFTSQIQGIRVEQDFRAWYEMMRRFNHMFGLGLDLSDLEQHSNALSEQIDVEVDEMTAKLGDFNVREFMEKLDTEYTELPFMPMDDVWAQELDDILDGLEGFDDQ
ncbi:MAG: PAC2 family protein [Caldilineaceae bacterium]|nr:PAC2 family protein [Caldilineaceae bacterium]